MCGDTLDHEGIQQDSDAVAKFFAEYQEGVKKQQAKNLEIFKAKAKSGKLFPHIKGL